LNVEAVDYHTAGEPFRIVTGGAPALEGRTILEKRRFAAERCDEIRRLLVFEPRGHADMYGCFVTEPEDEGADLGVVFFHNAGYSTACGHGTIALVTWALETGLLVREGPEASVVVDVPSGRLETSARIVGGRVESVRFRNVPAFVAARGLTAAGLGVDVAFGGAFYACVEARPAGLTVEPTDVPRFIELGRRIKRDLESQREFVHPLESELRDIYGVIFWQEEASAGAALVQTNVTVFADGEVDRSPCGSGTSARLALLDTDEELVHRSVIGTEFRARIAARMEVAGIPAVVTEVQGSAHYTGRHEFTLDPSDPLGAGFLLR
jgi:proline racemase